MRKLLTLILFLILNQLSVKAQEKRINLYGGYVFDDKFESYYDAYNYYNGKIKGGFQYGIGLEFKNYENFAFELLYIGQKSTAPTYYYDGISENTVYDLNLNYALLGLTKYFTKEKSKMEWYGGFMLGALFVSVNDPDTSYRNSTTKFCWGMRFGGNYWFTDNVGIKFQSQLLSSIQSAGGQLYFGSGGGTGNGVTTASSMLQFSLSSGLIFRFVKNDN